MSSGYPASRVLFIVHTSTVFVEPFRLAKLLIQHGVEPVFTFAYDHWTVDSFSDQCRDAGIRVYRPAGHCKAPAALAALFWSCARLLQNILPTVLTSFISSRRELRASLARARKTFATVKPRLLVLSIDLAGYDSGAYVKVAHEHGCKAMLVSSIMSIGLDQAEVYYNDPNYHVRGVTGRMIARMFPKWEIVHRSRPIFRVPPGRVLAMELLRIAPPKPWLFNSSWADVITMESEAMVDYYGAAGMPRGQMVVTGSTSDDVMAAVRTELEERRRALCQSLGLSLERPIILTALPPNFLDLTGGRPECDFRDYDDLVEFWLRSCASVSDHNVVIALHPSVPLSEAPKFERYGARVASLNTAELVPLCDIFVASISSTIRWAIACSKPVINYDVYRYRYTDFRGVDGVLTCEEKDEFRRLLERLASNRTFADEIRRKQAVVAEHWGRLDGRSGQRLVELVQRLLPGEQATPEARGRR